MYPLIDSLYVTLLLGALLLTLALRAVVAACRYWRGMLAGQRQLIDRINALLPQTQCGACGHEGCLPYARAIAAGQDINRCPPGGEATILRLAELVNDYPRPLHPAHGSPVTPRVAFIREAECIGCTKCIRACPVDAILGGPKLMHTVIASECTGCDLCVEPCPVDCIDMLPLPTTARPHWVLPSEVRSPTFPLDASR